MPRKNQQRLSKNKKASQCTKPVGVKQGGAVETTSALGGWVKLGRRASFPQASKRERVSSQQRAAQDAPLLLIGMGWHRKPAPLVEFHCGRGVTHEDWWPPPPCGFDDVEVFPAPGPRPIVARSSSHKGRLAIFSHDNRCTRPSLYLTIRLLRAPQDAMAPALSAAYHIVPGAASSRP